jgi:hypothetical protein
MATDFCYGEFCQPEDNSQVSTWIALGVVVALLIAIAALNISSFTGAELLDDPSFLGY